MLLTLWPMWESNIYWNGDIVGKAEGTNSVTVAPSNTLAVIAEGKNVTAVYSATS